MRVANGQRRATSDELAVKMQTPGIWNLGAAWRRFIQFPADDWHERHDAAEARVAESLHVVVRHDRNHNSVVEWAVHRLPRGPCLMLQLN